MLNYLWVAIGGALGTVARFWLSGVIARQIGETFPWGTLVVNVSGSLVIGFCAAYFGADSRFLVPAGVRQFVTIGILGGYTTFSSFSLQTLNLARDGEWIAAGANAAASFILCLVAVWVGHVAGVSASSMKG